MYPTRADISIVPPAELGRWLSKIVTSAKALRKALDDENLLPEGFPKGDIEALAATLEQTPGMSIEGALGALTYAGDKLEHVRQRWVVVADEAGDLPEMPWRGRIDTPRALRGADVRAARAWYTDAARETAEASPVPEALLAKGGTADLRELAGAAGANAATSAAIADKLDQHKTEGSISADNLIRGIRDVEVLNRQERIELGAVEPRVRLLDRLNRAAAASGEYSVLVARAVQVGADVAEIGFDLVHKIVIRSWIDGVREAGAALEKKIKSYQRNWVRTPPPPAPAKSRAIDTHSLSDGEIFRDRLENGTDGPEMVVIPACPGGFLMGSPLSERERRNSETQRRVEIPLRFALGRYAVTFDEYDPFCKATGRKRPDDGKWGRERRPVINVSWEDAVAWCDWMAGMTGGIYRLPSQAEWEYSCRGDRSGENATPFSPGVAWTGKGTFITVAEANFDGTLSYNGSPRGDYRKRTVPVDFEEFRPNGFGLWQMHGNVWEWCADDDTPNAHVEPYRVVRGGSWGDYPQYLRSADRIGFGPAHRNLNVGFRAARML